MHIRCSYCRHSFNLSREFMEMAVASGREKGQKYYPVECINCRKQIKVPLSQMERFLPPAEEDSEEAAESAES